MLDFEKVSFEDLPNCSGVYAFYLRKIESIPSHFQIYFKIEDPIYIGRTLSSFKSRDLKTHLGAGKSGQSTFRRSLLAILNLPCIPRSPNSKIYKGTNTSELELSKWIFDNLEIRIIKSMDPKNLELKMLDKFNPPLNLKDVKITEFTAILKKLRKNKI